MDKPNAGARGPAPANPGVIAASGDPVNPLRDPRDRRIPRVAGPCVMVMFGVTGDLARKKLMPALYDLANRGLLPPGFSLVGFARRDWEHEDFAQITDAGRQGARAHPVPRDGLAAAAGGRPVRARRVHRRRRVRPARRRRSRSSTPSAAPAATTRSTCPSRRSSSPRWWSSSSGPGCPTPARPDAARAQAVAAGGDREAVRPRPGDGEGAQRHRRRGVPRRVGVPHRPLPGQGDRTEHPGAALRQHPVRADLEPLLRGPRADHHVGGHRDRRPGRLLRRDRRRARRHTEPPAPAARADRDGGAGVVRRRLAAPGEGEDPVRRPAARRPRPGDGARPVRGRLAGRPPGRRLPRGGGHPRRLPDRDLRRRPAVRGHEAVGGRPVLPAHRQAAHPADDGDRAAVPAGAAPAVRGHRHQGTRAERPGDPGAAGRGRHACGSAPRCRAR